MSVVAVLSQTLRHKEAAGFLAERDDMKKVVVTRFAADLDPAGFPDGTEIIAWSPISKPRPSLRAVDQIGRVKAWIRGGSSFGFRIDRWVRSAEWRLRYIDRFLAVIEARRSAQWDSENPELVAVLEACIDEDPSCDIAVFDLFDLPVVLSAPKVKNLTVLVR